MTSINHKSGFCLSCFLFCATALAQTTDGRSKQVALSSGELVLATEGAMEPRSIGSLALRFYSASNADFPFDNFLSGLVRAREGALEDLLAIDFDDDGVEEIVTVVRSTGSGGYLSVEAFKISGGEFKLIGNLSFLESNADPIKSLRSELSY